ncbi:class D beta-lactamase [Rhodophyticola sp. CCM32]|uniref:class D beta-lactamase n=1 Tax=Rhodophyticola sp. CCM32 TaxID=2916397 RepID=UPI00107F6D57|nr:class D beta-lactamase [Rhodophyticola sp. CCM32]QBY01651.1 class D beta-lactamase [Rhodophyticola sp. CCM32]
MMIFPSLKRLCLTALLVVIPTLASATQVEIARTPLAAEIGDRDVAFLARDLETGTDYILEGSDLTRRHAPWSTFKIPNLLIALETGTASGLDHPYTWDQARRPPAAYWPEDWRQDQTLGSAFRRSAVWVFRDIAEQTGTDTYRQRLGEWGYGNADIPDGSDHFWLDDTLQISVAEQVNFLDRFFAGTLGLSAKSSDALIEISRDGQFGAAMLHGKTGAGTITQGDFNGRFEGWYTGFVLRPDAEPVIFSLYTRAPNYRALRDFRKDFAIRLLQRADLLPIR